VNADDQELDGRFTADGGQCESVNKRTNPLITEDPPDRTALTTRPSTWAADLISHRSVQLAIALWVAGIVAVVLIVHGSLPFNRPSFAGESIVSQVLNQQAQLLEELGLIALIVFLTRKRRIPDIASRAPVVSVSRREVLGMVAYAVGVQALGYALGRALGDYPISLHLPGTLYGLAGALPPSEVYLWAGYNFVAYAVLPYVFFRSRGYSNEALNLKSSNFWADVRLIAVVLIIESALELAFSPPNLQPDRPSTPARHPSGLRHLLRRHHASRHGVHLCNPAAALPATDRVGRRDRHPRWRNLRRPSCRRSLGRV